MTTSAIDALGPLFVRIDHVGFAVRDLDASKDFYARAFGLATVHEETNEGQGVREAMVAVGDSGSFIQLLSPLGPDTTVGKFIERNGEGIQQVAFEVTDVVAAAERLKAANVRVLYDEPRVGTAGSLVNFVHPKDAGGVLIELVQHTGTGH
jgi:methylmalonyl-CoA/ethylmalonyl-CoA epimerase